MAILLTRILYKTQSYTRRNPIKASPDNKIDNTRHHQNHNESCGDKYKISRRKHISVSPQTPAIGRKEAANNEHHMGRNSPTYHKDQNGHHNPFGGEAVDTKIVISTKV